MTEYPPEIIILISIMCIALLILGHLYDRKVKNDRIIYADFMAKKRLAKKKDVFFRRTAAKRRKVAPILNTPSMKYIQCAEHVANFKSELKYYEDVLDHEGYGRCIDNFIYQIDTGNIFPFKFPENIMTTEDLYFPAIRLSAGYVVIRDYKVGVNSRKCTCDWMKKFETFEHLKIIPKTDIRRVCRHQVEVIAMSRDLDCINATEIAKAIFGHIYRKEYYFELILAKEQVRALIGFDANIEWVDIFINEYTDGNRFGYNIRKKDWRYGHRPTPFAKQIKQAIHSSFGVGY